MTTYAAVPQMHRTRRQVQRLSVGHDAPHPLRRGKSRPPVRVPGGRGAYAIRALPEEKPRLLKKTGPEVDNVRPLKSPVSPSFPTRNVAFGSAPCLICALG